MDIDIIGAVPFYLKDGGEIFDPIESGFHRLNKSLQELGDMTVERQAGMELEGVDAIPSSTAHVLKLHRDMDTEGLTKGYAEENWRRVMTIFALSKYRAYRVEISVLKERDVNPLLWSIYLKKIAHETGTENQIHMLQLEGEDIAIFDRKGFLLPVASMPLAMDSEFGHDCIESLYDYEKNIMLIYLEQIADAYTRSVGYLKSFIEDLKKAGAVTMPGSGRYEAFGNDGIRRGIYGEDVGTDMFWNVPALAVEVPPIFHDRLVLTVTDKEANRIRSLGEEINYGFALEDTEGTEYISGYLPLSEQFLDLIFNDRNVEVLNLKVDERKFKSSQELTVSVQVRVYSERIWFRKVYSRESICCAASNPLVSVFPYVSLPGERWNEYYLVVSRAEKIQEGGFGSLLDSLDEVEGDTIDIMGFSRRRSTAKMNPGKTWYYAKEKELPRFVRFCTANFELDDEERNTQKQGNYIGCICTGTPRISQLDGGGSFHWAIDLGTRNTISAFRSEGMENISHRMLREGLYQTVMGAPGIADETFARQCFTPDAEIDGSFSTMCRIYLQGLEERESNSYEQGCALFPNLRLMNELLNDRDSLVSDYIITDVKFSDENDKLHEKALQIYLHNMLWLGSLECVLRGATNMQICVSYPRIDVKTQISKIWNMVVRQMETVTDINYASEISYFTEAEANARYLQKNMKGRPKEEITRGSTFGLCDIGDGTTDFNLFLGESDGEDLPPRVQFSMRYAGRDILVDTIMWMYSGKKKEFRGLWNIPSDYGRNSKKDIYENANTLINTYQKYDDADRKTDNEKKIYTNNKRNIILTLLENAGLSNKLNVSADAYDHKFTAVLLFKYWQLFRVYGTMLELFRNRQTTFSFRFYVYGGGKLALQNALGKNLEGFAETNFGKDMLHYLAGCAGVDEDAFTGILDSEYRKLEVVEGMISDADSNKEDKIKNEAYDNADKVDQYYQNFYGNTLPSKIYDENKRDFLMEAYQRHISMLGGKDYFRLKWKGETKDLSRILSIGRSGAKPSEQEISNRAAYAKMADNCWRKLWNDKDNPRCLLDILFCVEMADNILRENL